MAVLIGGDTPLDDAAAEARAQNLMREIRCVVCDSEPVSHSTADIAVDMRRQIRQQVDAGASNSEVREFFRSRYGQYVLFRPPTSGAGILIWLFPFLLLVGGGLLISRKMLGKRNKSLTPLSTDSEQSPED